MIEIKKVLPSNGLKDLLALAATIWSEHYSALLGINQVNYMTTKFQSLDVIKEQIIDKNEYHFVKFSGKRIGY